MITETGEFLNPWTDALIERLKVLWGNGLSCSQIAAELGRPITRNAVIGKVHRLRLPGRNPVARKAALPPRQKLRREHKPTWVRKVMPEAFLPPQPLPPGSAWAALPGSVPIQMVDLTEKTCRWPIGTDRPYLFCGCATTAGPYCEVHSKRSSHPIIPANNKGG